MTASPHVLSQSYGKSRVRLSRIERFGERHEFIELEIGIQLQGTFDAAYSDGDNSLVIATDTMKNTVYVLASKYGVPSIEAFAQRLAVHFLASYSHVDRVEIRCEQVVWSRMTVGENAHEHVFIGGQSERSTCEIASTRRDARLRSGFQGLQVLKTTASGFSGFHRDQYTTLPETDDRIFATAIEASWPCLDLAQDWFAWRKVVRQALVDVFANQFSKSVQHTLYEMAKSALNACPAIDEISIAMPNQHHLLAKLDAFGLANPNEVFVPTSEPFGMISATIGRHDLKRDA